MAMSIKSVFIIFIALFAFSCENSVSWFYPVHDDGTLLYTTTNGAYHFVLYRTPNSDFLTTATVISGERLWTKKIARQIDNARVVTAGKYLISSCEKGMLCLFDAFSGEKKAMLSSPVTVAAGEKGMTLVDDVFYYLCSDREICAYDVHGEKQLWKSPPLTAPLSFDFSVRNERLIYAVGNARIVGTDISDGKTVWEQSVPSAMSTIVFLEESLVVYSAGVETATFYAIQTGEKEKSYLVSEILGKDETAMFAVTKKDDKRFFSACSATKSRWEISLGENDAARFLASQAVLSVVSEKTVTILNGETGLSERKITVECDKVVDIKQIVSGVVWLGVKRNGFYEIAVIDGAGRERVSYKSEADYATIFGEKNEKVYLKTIIFNRDSDWLYKTFSEDGRWLITHAIDSYASVKKGDFWQLFEQVQLYEGWEIRSHRLE